MTEGARPILGRGATAVNADAGRRLGDRRVQPGPAQILGNAPAQTRQRPAEDQHVPVFRLAAHLAPPARVITVLLASARVAAGGLDVAARIGRDPDLDPGGRYHQGSDPLQRRSIVDPAILGIAVDKALARSPPRDSRSTVGYDT